MKKDKLWVGVLAGVVLSQGAVAEDTENKQVFSNLPFQLIQQYGSSCMEVESKGFELNACIYDDPVSGRCYARNRAVMKPCAEGLEAQNWFYDPELRRLHLSGYSRTMCLTRMVRSVEMQPCIKEGNVAQQWYFSEEGLLKSQADTKESGSFIYAVENQDLTLFHLKYQFTAPDLEPGQCYVHPVTREQSCAKDIQDGVERDSSGEVENSAIETDVSGDINNDPLLEPEPSPKENDSVADDSNPESSEDHSAGNRADDLKPPEKPRPQYWLSRRLTPWLTLQTTGSRCLALKLPEGCFPSGDNGESRVCLGGAEVEVTHCLASAGQQWQHDLQTKKIYNRLSGYDLCLTLRDKGVSMEGCYVNAEDSQRWYFSMGGKVSYGQRGLLRTMVNGLRTPYLYTEKLNQLPAPAPDPDSRKLKFRITPDQPEGCFYHPVTGAKLEGSGC